MPAGVPGRDLVLAFPASFRKTPSTRAIGIITSIVVLYSVQRLEEPLVSGFLYAAVGIFTCVIVGYVASIVLGGETRPVAGLELKTLKQQEE